MSDPNDSGGQIPFDKQPESDASDNSNDKEGSEDQLGSDPQQSAFTQGSTSFAPNQPEYELPEYGQPEQGQAEYGQPQYSQPEYGQNAYGQQQFDQAQYGQNAYGQPWQGQSQYGESQNGQPAQGQPQYGQPGQNPPPNWQGGSGQNYGYQQPGAPYGPAYGPAPYGYTPKSKVVAGVLGILLGGFGAHNFYLGNTGKALAQLLMTVLSLGLLSWASAIWGFIEGVLILVSTPGTKWHQDARGIELLD